MRITITADRVGATAGFSQIRWYTLGRVKVAEGNRDDGGDLVKQKDPTGVGSNR